MVKLKIKDLRKLTPAERVKKLEDLKKELQGARAINASGGSQTDPMVIRQTRRAIARILTLEREAR